MWQISEQSFNLKLIKGITQESSSWGCLFTWCSLIRNLVVFGSFYRANSTMKKQHKSWTQHTTNMRHSWIQYNHNTLITCFIVLSISNPPKMFKLNVLLIQANRYFSIWTWPFSPQSIAVLKNPTPFVFLQPAPMSFSKHVGPLERTWELPLVTWTKGEGHEPSEVWLNPYREGFLFFNINFFRGVTPKQLVV